MVISISTAAGISSGRAWPIPATKVAIIWTAASNRLGSASIIASTNATINVTAVSAKEGRTAIMPSNKEVRILIPVSTTCGSWLEINSRASFKICPRVSIKAGAPPVSNAPVSSSTQPLTIGITVPAKAVVKPPASSPLRLSTPSFSVASWPEKVLDWASIAP